MTPCDHCGGLRGSSDPQCPVCGEGGRNPGPEFKVPLDMVRHVERLPDESVVHIDFARRLASETRWQIEKLVDAKNEARALRRSLVVRMIFGRGVWARFTEAVPGTDDVDLLDDLATYSLAGIKLEVSSAPDWPDTAIMAETADGRWHSVQR